MRASPGLSHPTRAGGGTHGLTSVPKVPGRQSLVVKLRGRPNRRQKTRRLQLADNNSGCKGYWPIRPVPISSRSMTQSPETEGHKPFPRISVRSRTLWSELARQLMAQSSFSLDELLRVVPPGGRDKPAIKEFTSTSSDRKDGVPGNRPAAASN